MMMEYGDLLDYNYDPLLDNSPWASETTSEENINDLEDADIRILVKGFFYNYIVIEKRRR